MATFYYNRFSSENIYSQWARYLQTNAYVGDIGRIVSQNRQELQSTIENASSEQKKALQQVCGQLDTGFGEVNRYLQDINFNISELRGEINAMASMLDWKLSLLIEEQRLTNQLLGHIAQLLRIPDSQKQRVYHIEQGLKYLKNAILEGLNSAFYIDALESFKEAEKIERKDYITLNRIGQIYLYSQKYLNIPLAEEYFLKSAREAFAEANAGGTTTSNQLTPLGHQPIIYSQNPFKAATAEAYIYASRTCYLQQKLPEAADLAGKAYSLVPEFIEAGFEQAKYLAANGKESESVKVLETVINKDRFFSIKTLTDQDLATKPSVLNLLETFQQKTISKAKSGLNECKKIMKSKSNAEEVISEIEIHISKDNFLSGMKALDLLNADFHLPYNLYKDHGEDVKRKTVTPNQKIFDYLKKENQSAKDFEEVMHKAKTEIIKTNIIVFGLGGAALGFVIGFFAGCSVKHFSMEWGTWFLTTIICAAIGSLIGFFIGQGKDPNINDDPYLN